MAILLTDDDVIRHLTPTEAVTVMETVFLQRAQGTYAGVPRWGFPFGPEKNLTLTVGSGGQSVGFRAYLRGQFPHNDQLVAAWDAQTGALRGVVVGPLLGAMRTGAIGGLAVKYLARFDATRLGLIGTGRQAYAQLQAILAVRPTLQTVRVYSRTPEHRQQFVADVQALFKHLDIQAVDTPEAAIRHMDVVVGATNSTTPVIRGDWLKAGAHLTTVGPKGAVLREIDEQAVRRANFIVTDSSEQLSAYQFGSLLDGSGQHAYDLAAVVSQQAGRPTDEAVTLFVSTGLAGTEVALAEHLIRKVAATQP